jgi:uncharacterized membrane protein
MTEMVALSFAIMSCLAYGVADFLGGLAARQASALRVVAIAAPASLAVDLALVPLVGASWSVPVATWGAASGAASAAAFALLYRCLALGPMSILSPTTALTVAVLPLCFALVIGEGLGDSAKAGIGLGLVAIVLTTAGGPSDGRRPTSIALALAIGAGIALAAQLLCLRAAPHDSGVAPLVVGRAVSSAILLGAVPLFASKAARGTRPPLTLAIGAGSLDSLANLFFLEAARAGQLAVTAIVVALYPAVTIALAHRVLDERLHPRQWSGLALAGAAATLLALP